MGQYCLDAALARIQRASRKRRAAVLVCGNHPRQRTKLLRQVAELHREAGRRVIALDAGGLSGPQFLDAILAGLGNPGGPALAPPPDFPVADAPETFWRRIVARLAELRFLGRPITLLLEGVASADPAVPSWVARLLALPATATPERFLLLSCSAEMVDTLSAPLPGRMDMRIDLE